VSSRLKLVLIAVALLAAMAAVSAPWLGRTIYPRIELAPLWYPVLGVDVSNHQGTIDWPSLAASGVAFAYIKATEGGAFRDRQFARNWSEAARAGVPRGAYHFFTICRSAAHQARNFIAAVPSDPAALPPAVDVEHMGPCTESPPNVDHAAEIREFLDLVERHFGVRPLIYTTAEFDAAMLAGALPGERFWARSLILPPRFRRDQWLIWQYHSRGRRPGIKGPVDLNVFRGTPVEFRRFAAAAPTAATGR